MNARALLSEIIRRCDLILKETEAEVSPGPVVVTPPVSQQEVTA